MKQRVLASFRTGVIVAVIALASGPVIGQSQSSARKAAPAAKKWTPAKTPDGQLDLQGYWTNSTYTPLERPNNVTKEYYTDAEFEALIKQAVEREEEQTVPG